MFLGSCVGYELKFYLWEKNAVLDFRNMNSNYVQEILSILFSWITRIQRNQVIVVRYSEDGTCFRACAKYRRSLRRNMSCDSADNLRDVRSQAWKQQPASLVTFGKSSQLCIIFSWLWFCASGFAIAFIVVTRLTAAEPESGKKCYTIKKFYQKFWIFE